MVQPSENTQTIHVGYTDLTHDAEKIAQLLKAPENVGIVVNVSYFPNKNSYVYRPTKPLPTEKDVIREMRKFLMLISILQGKATLTAIKNLKDKPANTVDFEKVCQAIQVNNSLFRDYD